LIAHVSKFHQSPSLLRFYLPSQVSNQSTQFPPNEDQKRQAEEVTLPHVRLTDAAAGDAHEELQF
jgi:hypothetical protein